MSANPNTMPNQQLDANMNKECTGSKRSNSYIGDPSKRPRVEEAHPPLTDDETLGSGVEPMDSNDEQLTKRDDVEANNANTTVLMEKRKKRDVSLVERFTEEEIEMHIKSLHEGSVELKDSETCQLCGEGHLSFPAPPLYCSVCTSRIQYKLYPYYTPQETINGAQLQICNPCYRSTNKFKLASGVTILKSNMVKHTIADNQDKEDYVYCETCGKWQHQICGLYNPDKDIDNTSDYICPFCLLKERKSNNNMGSVHDNTDLGAKDLPETILSDFIEKRLRRRLKEERQQTATATGKSIDDVSLPDDLTLRVVFSGDKSSHVNKAFADFLQDEDYPSEFPYRSKVILLFQKVDGVDVCIFALFVQEFGSECSKPNERSVYILYLDSVKYFRPERVTSSGEALRTFVYHEILIGYLEYCQLRGFTTGYIWSCPPQKGDDFIMYSHPKTQQTPNTEQLRQWYKSMLKKAKDQSVVTNVTNFYDRFFVSTTDNITAAELPYFEGSFWSDNAELLSQRVEEDAINLISGSAPSGNEIEVDYDVRNSWLMQELGELISGQKEDLIVMDLAYTCTRCSNAILSRVRWFCKKCNNLQLCQRCHDDEEERPGEHTYTMNGEEKHSLLKVRRSIQSTTEDNDVILGNNNTFQTRQMFLSFSQKHNYSFDTLRRAKHSSMMILHHLHTSNKLHQASTGDLLQVTCTACQKDVTRTIYYSSLCCSWHRVCTSCYNKNKDRRLLHIFPTVPSANGMPPRSVGAFEILQGLLHANACVAATGSCSHPRCSDVKMLFNHIEVCQKQRGACNHCINYGTIISIHAYHCQDRNCSIPRCRRVKEQLTRKGLR